jgi:hypothetical protein
MSDSRLTAISSRCDIKATVQRQSVHAVVPSRRAKGRAAENISTPPIAVSIARDVMRSCALAGKRPARLGPRAAGGWRTLRWLMPVLVAAAMLTRCARDGGIGLEAMMADHNCEQAGYQLGIPQCADCRMELARRADAAAVPAYY